MDMNLNEQLTGADVIIDEFDEAPEAAAANRPAPRLPQMMRRIPVTLTPRSSRTSASTRRRS